MSVWIGYGIASSSPLPAPRPDDPHITLAYIPADVGPHNQTRILTFALEPFRNRQAAFYATPTEFATFGPPDEKVQVLRVDLPAPVRHAVNVLRDEIYAAGFDFSRTYPFDPHVTLAALDSATSVPNEPLLVESVFLHDSRANRRTTLYLRK